MKDFAFFYRLYYATYTPFLGLHYFKMAKLLQQVSDKTSDLKESMTLVDKVRELHF